MGRNRGGWCTEVITVNKLTAEIEPETEYQSWWEHPDAGARYADEDLMESEMVAEYVPTALRLE